MSFWSTGIAYAWPALLFTVVGLVLRRTSRDPQTPRGDAILVDIGLGLVAVTASVFWLRAFSSLVF